MSACGWLTDMRNKLWDLLIIAFVGCVAAREVVMYVRPALPTIFVTIFAAFLVMVLVKIAHRW